MKVAIVSIDDYINYGNRLQNYALSKLIENEKVKVVTLEGYYTKNKIKKFVLSIFKKRVWILVGKKNHENRMVKFAHFSDRYIKRNVIIYSSEKQFLDRAEKKKYAALITGSDQVWNPSFAGKPHHFLTFAPPEKRIACMASIGVTELPEEVIPNYKKWLSEMKYISVREKSAATLIENLTGRKVDVFLDPTLLLSRAEWLNLCKKPKAKLPEKYLVSFFLGERPEEIIEKCAEQYQLPIVYLENKDFPEYYTLDPAEFLYVLLHSELVLTDSFHGTALSIKLWKQFYVFNRKEKGMDNMFTRIEMLLEMFGLEERYRERYWEEGYLANINSVDIEKFKWIESETQKENIRFKEIIKKYIGNEK